MNCEETAERVTCQNAVGLHSIALLDLGNNFCFYELQEIVGAAGRRELRGVGPCGLCRRQIACAVGVSNAYDDYFRHPAIASQELDCAAGMSDVGVAISHIEHWIGEFVGRIPRRCAHQYHSVFSQHAGLDCQLLRSAILRESRRRKENQKYQSPQETDGCSSPTVSERTA